MANRRRRHAEDALFLADCTALLVRDEEFAPVSDEAIYAYASGRATAEERVRVEDAMLASKSFCDELLELTKYLESIESPQPPDEPSEQRRGLFAWRPRFALAAGVAAIALVVAVGLVVRLRAPGRLPEALHLAVLPVECTGDAISSAFCDGLAATMTDKVSLFERFNRSFWVVPAEAVTRAKVTDPRAAGRRFGATMALTGRLERLEDRFRLTLVLMNLLSPAPTPLRSAVIAGPVAELSTLQVSVAQQVARMLDMHLLTADSDAFAQGNTDVAAAYQSYVEGRGHLQRYDQVAELEAAVAAFTSAIEADSAYALAHTALAEAYWRMFREDKDTRWIARAKDELALSLALDSTLATTRVVYGNVMNQSGEYQAAVASFQRAASIDSAAAGIYNGLATSYARLERLDEAEATYRRAIAVKPDYWGGYSDLGLFYYNHGRIEDAAVQYRRITELTPDNYLAFNNLGVMYYSLERWDDARAAFLTSNRIERNERACIHLGVVDYIEAKYDSSAYWCNQAISLNDRNYKSWANLGNAYYWTPGKREQAMDAYRRAIVLAETTLALNPKDANVIASLSGYYSVVGDNEKARSYADSALAISPESRFVVYFAGYVYEQLGDRARALELMSRAVELGYPVKEIERDPWLVDLRADPRFQQLLDTRK